jgi:hypothetical protein
MTEPAVPMLAELVEAIRRARVREFTDLFLERRVEVCWRLAEGKVCARELLLREGAALRRDGALISVDGLDRPTLAELLAVAGHRLPALRLPPLPPPPSFSARLFEHVHGLVSVRWRWSWAAVLTGAGARDGLRPQLAELTFADGQRALSTWPPAVPDQHPAPTLAAVTPRVGAGTVLLAPAATAVLVHELFGHLLEADMLRRGASPWSRRRGERVLKLALDVTDDPTRGDLPGGFALDDEGVPAAARPLLADGIIVGALADRATAAPAHTEPGNARRAHVHVPPRPRISNLVVAAADALPAPPRVDAEIEVAALDAGTIDTASGWLALRVRQAWALRRGARIRALAPCTLLGRVAVVCDGIHAAAHPSMVTAAPGWCNKDGDVVPVGTVAPWLLITGLEAR